MDEHDHRTRMVHFGTDGSETGTIPAADFMIAKTFFLL
jgi:hypothetical protein